MNFCLPIVLIVSCAGLARAGDIQLKVSLFGIFRPREVNLSGDARVITVTEDGRRKALRAKKINVRCGGVDPVMLQTGSTRLAAGSVEVEALRGRLSVSVPRGPEREYQGRIEIREKKGGCLIIDHLPLDSYARDVACRELSGAGPQALRAQAVLSRTYALKSLGRHEREGFDLCDLTHCQVFTGAGACTPAQTESLRKVSGLALLYRKRPADVYYFSTCGGHTAAAADVWGPSTARPYLKGVSDGDPPACSGSPHARWHFEVERDKLCAELEKTLPELGTGSCRIEVLQRGSGGWVKRVAIRARKTIELTGEKFHLLMGRIFGWGAFKSARFRLQPGRQRLNFFGRGLGHGVGMCQYGAMGMERAGRNFREILLHYFPGTEVGRWP